MTSLEQNLPETLTTDRLALVTPALRHVPAMARLANNAAVVANLSRLPFPYQESDAEFFVTNIARQPGEWVWCIEMDGELVGTIGLHFADDRLPEIGYWLGQPYWGRGIATEAAGAVIEAARGTGLVPGLCSRALVTNAASQNVLRKSGFTALGEAPDRAGNLAGKAMVLFELDFAR